MKVIVTMRAPMRVLFERRGDLSQLLHREPDNENRGIAVAVSQKLGDEWTPFEPRTWRSLNKAAIAHVEEAA